MRLFTYHEMATFIHDNAEKPACKESLEAMIEEDTITDNIEYFFSEARETTLAELADRGVSINRELKSVTVRDREALLAADELLAQITSDYEGETSHNWWELLGLGGDDDVDYNGGYLMSNLDVLRAMMGEDHA